MLHRTYTWLVLLFALRYTVPEHSELLRQRWQRTCQSDLLACPRCFADNRADDAAVNCSTLIAGLRIPIVWPHSVLDLLALNVRPVQRGRLADTDESVYVKHTPLSAELRTLLAASANDDDDDALIDRLSGHFQRNWRPDGLQILPLTARSVHRFVHTFAAPSGRSILPWLWLNAGAETMLLSALGPRGFAVPAVRHHAGLVTVVADGGQPLAEWLTKDVSVVGRLRVVRELLVAAVRFTEGVEGFRLYLTDVTADNVVVDTPRRVTFVDLDSVVAVDSRALPGGSGTWHRHVPLPCDGCFAFDPAALAASAEASDFNVYVVCNLIVSDARWTVGEFPDHYADMLDQVRKCNECNERTGCENRLAIARQMIASIVNVIG